MFNFFSCSIFEYDHVVNNILIFQADFATSAVDFLHRVGRTGRAGQYGLVTSLYTKSNSDLVAAVRGAGELDQSVVNSQTCKTGTRCFCGHIYFRVVSVYSLKLNLNMHLVIQIIKRIFNPLTLIKEAN